jgi:hypothetical protein
VTAITQLKMGLAVCCLIVAAGCAQKNESNPVSKDPGVAVSGIAVMPVRSAVDFEDAVSSADEKSLRDGSQVMNGLLKQVLAGKPGVRFVSEQPRAGANEKASNKLEAARRIAAQQGCNAVLETTLSRYSERVGGDYGVKQSAAVTFAYKLYEVGEGRVLCHGRFDEQQQSVMENLLALPKAQSRGLTWLTAEELARDGLQEKLGQCSYLGGK